MTLNKETSFREDQEEEKTAREGGRYARDEMMSKARGEGRDRR